MAAEPLSMFQASAPVFLQGLGALSGVLEKAGAHAAARELDPPALLQARLYPDMFPLVRQVQIAADFAKGTVARLAGAEVPKFEDAETSLEELRGRLQRTADFVRTIAPERIDGSEDREISISAGGQPMTFAGRPYLLHFALPNFWFHTTTAYAILRHNGVEVGKRDFIGTF